MISFIATGARNTCASIRSLPALAGLAAVAIIAQASAASAQLIVVQSNAKSIKTGALLTNSTKLAIPAGAKVVFVLPSGASRTITGPFKGRAGSLTKGVKSNPSIFDAVKRYVYTGGASDKSLGAIRGAAPAFKRVRSLPFSWRTVPITASGDFCIEKGASVTLARTRTKTAQNITIIDMKSGRRVPVRFPPGVKNIAWPDHLNIASGATYTLARNDRPPQEMTMRIIAPLPEREETLQILHGQRCHTQFRKFIRELQATG